MAAAIFHGKRAANLAQAMRVALVDGSPSRESRRAFLKQRRQVYVTLAQWLLDQRRLREAEFTLQLLKEDEGQQFIGSDPRATMGTVPLTAAERTLARQDDDAVEQLVGADRIRVAALAELPIGAGAVSLFSRSQIESARLRLGLALPDLPARLERTPLRNSSDAISHALERDLVSFFAVPGRRLEQFLDHLIEDSRHFEAPPGARERASLADSLKSLPRIRAELAPLLRHESQPSRRGTERSNRLRAGVASTDDDDNPWSYVAAEPLERIWRSIDKTQHIETDTLSRHGNGLRMLAAGAGAAGDLTGTPDDSLALLAGQSIRTTLLYFSSGEDRLDALLVSASGRRHWRIALPRSELDASVAEFIRLLKHTERDPRPAAQALYQRLFAPVAQAVADTGARVLALSLAGTLRYVPFAALHDGQGWLVERYALALHPGGALAGRLRPGSPTWRAAAFGATAGSAEFAPLPNVRSEIASVVRSDGSPSGVLPGTAWLDQAFTAQRLRNALAGDAQVLHLASHFKFVPGDADASYLLLGDGGKLSLHELAGPAYRFDRTELVTLSACATGLSADDAFGQEVDGLAALLMGQGAPSVLASLWDVNDSSTATLMASLYRLHEQQRLSLAQALQQAQLTMIRAAADQARAARLLRNAAYRACGCRATPRPLRKQRLCAAGRARVWPPFPLGCLRIDGQLAMIASLRQAVAAVLRGIGLLSCIGAAAPCAAVQHALLVGVSQYPNLPIELQLKAPANDVRLMRQVLLQRGFAADHIETLADGVEGARLPTRASVVGALQGLAGRARNGDTVFVHFSGHGSLQSINDGPAASLRWQPVFLPRDVQGWNGKLGAAVPQAIGDTELRDLFDRINDSGAFVFALFRCLQFGEAGARGLGRNGHQGVAGAPGDSSRARHRRRASARRLAGLARTKPVHRFHAPPRLPPACAGARCISMPHRVSSWHRRCSSPSMVKRSGTACSAGTSSALWRAASR